MFPAHRPVDAAAVFAAQQQHGVEGPVGLRAVIREVVDVLRDGKSVVLTMADLWMRRTRESICATIRSKADLAAVMIRCIIAHPQCEICNPNVPMYILVLVFPSESACVESY